MSHLQTRNRLGGFTLLISLVLLTVLTLIGMASVEHVLVDEKMSANTQAKMQVFMAASTEIDAQFEHLKGNHATIMRSLLADVQLVPASHPAHTEITGVLSFKGEYERRARRKQQIQSMGLARVLVAELAVTAKRAGTGVLSRQTRGIELPLPPD